MQCSTVESLFAALTVHLGLQHTVVTLDALQMSLVYVKPLSGVVSVSVNELIARQTVV